MPSELSYDVARSGAWTSQPDAFIDEGPALIKGIQHCGEGITDLFYKNRRPICRGCQRAWRWPRNLSHVNLDVSTPKNISPTTQSTVVAYLTAVVGSDPPAPSFPEAVFKNIEYGLPWTPEQGPSTCCHWCQIPHRLVTECEYDTRTGDVYYGEEVEECQHGRRYARLVTLNSWYDQLLVCFGRVGSMLLDYYCNFVLLLSLLSKDNANYADIDSWLKYSFFVGWLTMVLVQCIWSFTSASHQYRVLANYRKGDLVQCCSKYDVWKSYAALVCFTFLSIEKSVRDVVMLLHPWKSVRPYASFKSNGSRAYLLGYLNKDMFMVEEFRGLYWQMFTQQLLNTMVFGVKLYMCSLTSSSTRASLITSCVTSCPSVFWGWKVWLNLSFARKRMKQTLLKKLAGGPRPSEMSMSLAKTEKFNERELQACRLIYFAHFGKCELLTQSSSMSNAKPKCKDCGRDPPHADSALEGPLASNGAIVPGKTWVELSPKFLDYHDAKYGPLQDPDGDDQPKIGKVLEIRDVVFGVGPRCLVSAIRPCKNNCGYQATWDGEYCCGLCAHRSEAAGPQRGEKHGKRCKKKPLDDEEHGIRYWYDLGAVKPLGIAAESAQARVVGNQAIYSEPLGSCSAMRSLAQTKDEDRTPIETEIAELQHKLRVLENDKQSCSEDVQGIVGKQRATIEKLTRENLTLKAELNDTRHFSSSQVESEKPQGKSIYSIT